LGQEFHTHLVVCDPDAAEAKGWGPGVRAASLNDDE
jgi:hypothetical protein